jgi:hypothetical protein
MNTEFKKGFKSVFLLTKNKTRERISLLSTEERISRNWSNIGLDIKNSMDKFNLNSNYVKKSNKI